MEVAFKMENETQQKYNLLHSESMIGSSNVNNEKDEIKDSKTDLEQVTICSIHSVVPEMSPDYVKIRLLPLVITIEIFHTLMTTGSVSIVILCLRYVITTKGLAAIAVTSLCYTIMIFTMVHFARKWRKLVPPISVTCYSYVALHLLYITYKFLEACLYHG